MKEQVSVLSARKESGVRNVSHVQRIVQHIIVTRRMEIANGVKLVIGVRSVKNVLRTVRTMCVTRRLEIVTHVKLVSGITSANPGAHLSVKTLVMIRTEL